MYAIAVLTLALTTSAPALKDRPSEPASLDGEWALVSRVIGGKPCPEVPRQTELRFVIGGGQWVIRQPGTPDLVRRFESDPAGRPATFAVCATAPAAGQKPDEMIGIYKLDRDTLVSATYSRGCDRRSSTPRPGRTCGSWSCGG